MHLAIRATCTIFLFKRIARSEPEQRSKFRTVSSVDSGKNHTVQSGRAGKIRAGKSIGISAINQQQCRRAEKVHLAACSRGGRAHPALSVTDRSWRERVAALAASAGGGRPRPPGVVAAGPTAASRGGGRCHVPPGAPAATRGGGLFSRFHSQVVSFDNPTQQGVLLDKNSDVGGLVHV